MFFPQPPREGFTGGPENTLSSEASRAQARRPFMNKAGARRRVLRKDAMAR